MQYPLSLEGSIGVLFVSSSCYGAFFVLFILSTLVLHHQCRQNKLQSSGPVGTTIYLTFGYLIFALNTTSWILAWIMFMNPNVVTEVFDGHTSNHSVFLLLQNFTGNSALFVADLVLAYRLYIVWNKRRIMLWAGILMILTYIGLLIPYVVFYAKKRVFWNEGTALLTSMNLCVTILATTLISWKIWNNSRLTRAIGGQSIIRQAIAILVESAALSTVWMLAFLILHFLKYHGSHVLLYGAPEVAGIATALVNVRVGLGWAAGEEGRSARSLNDYSSSINPDARSVALDTEMS